MQHEGLHIQKPKRGQKHRADDRNQQCSRARVSKRGECSECEHAEVRQRAKQGGVELPLIISDHADWDELTDTIVETGASEVWVTHGREEALVRWCELNGIAAQPVHLIGYEDEGD